MSARSIKYIHAVLHTALQTAVKWGKLSHNPADMVELPKPEHTEMKVWDEKQITEFLTDIRDNPYFPLFFTFLFTGCRRGELLGLAWGNVDFLYGQIAIVRTLHCMKDGFIFSDPKTARSKRIIYLTPLNIAILRELYEREKTKRVLTDDSLVFAHPDGAPLRPGSVSRAWDNLIKEYGLPPIRLHDARHSHISLLMKQNVNIKVISERAGHSNVSTALNIYAHLYQTSQADAAKHFDEAFNLRYNANAVKNPVSNLLANGKNGAGENIKAMTN